MDWNSNTSWICLASFNNCVCVWQSIFSICVLIYIYFWPFSFSYSPLVYNFLLCSLSPSLSPSVSYPPSPCQSVSYFSYFYPPSGQTLTFLSVKALEGMIVFFLLFSLSCLSLEPRLNFSSILSHVNVFSQILYIKGSWATHTSPKSTSMKNRDLPWPFCAELCAFAPWWNSVSAELLPVFSSPSHPLPVTHSAPHLTIASSH